MGTTTGAIFTGSSQFSTALQQAVSQDWFAVMEFFPTFTPTTPR